MILHITNGDNAVTQLRKANIGGDLLGWSDVLHEGPVPPGLSLDALRDVRARFIAEQGWGDLKTVLADFTARDRTLAASGGYEEIVLWFEEDLYDRLQLLQLLDWFSWQKDSPGRVSLCDVPEYLGTLPEERIRECFETRRLVKPEDLNAARSAWEAFRNPDPTVVETLMHKGIPGLPRVDAAFLRHLQEFPSVKNGLSLSEENALRAILSGRSILHETFVASHHEREEHIFLGDAVFAVYVQRLSLVEKPLVVFDDGSRIVLPRDPAARETFWKKRTAVTPTGKDILNGKLDFVRLNGVDRWRGGVYLNGRGSLWRWDTDGQRLHYL